MEKIKKNLGFGFMRLPMQGEEVDLAQTQQMVDAFLAAGFNYFDTAHGYLDGRSETALKACLTSRYPREDYVLTNKLTSNFFKTEADIRPFFESQLAACGVGGDGDRARIVQGRVAHTDQLILDGRIAAAALVALGDGQLHGQARRGAGRGADLDGQDAGEKALTVDGVLAGVRGHFDTLNKCAFHS